MFWTVPLSIIRSFSLYTHQWYVIQVCWQFQAGSGWNILILLVIVSKPVWHILLLCVQWKTPDDGQTNCPKHVEFHSKSKFEKLVHLVGFIIRNLSRCTVTWKSKKNEGHLFSNCNMTLCHSMEATECWKARINSCSSDTLTEVSNEECLIECDTALLGKCFVTFWRDMSTFSSWIDHLWRWRQHNPSKHLNPFTQWCSHTTEDSNPRHYIFWMVAANYADPAKGVRRVRRPSIDWLIDLTDWSTGQLNELFIYLLIYTLCVGQVAQSV